MLQFTDMQEATLRQYVDVLRTTQHKQGYGELRRGNCYCALGLFLDMLDHNAWEYNAEHSALCIWGLEHSGYTLPTYINGKHITEYVGADSLLVTMLCVLNDAERLAFAAIADELEYVLNYREYSPSAIKALKADGYAV